MKFNNILQEIFSDKNVSKNDYYKIDKPVIDTKPNIVKNGLNDLNPDGTLKRRKKGEIR